MNNTQSFIDEIEKHIQSGKVELPVFNPTALRVQQELVKKDPDIQGIEKLIVRDQTLASEVLRLANSSYYRGLAEVKTVKAAVVRLGMREIGRVVLLAATKNQFRSSEQELNRMMIQLWQHSAGCGLAANWLARRCSYEKLAGRAFFAGLLHDIGKLFILMVIEQVKKASSMDMTKALFMEVIDTLHTGKGYALMQQWNMPEEYCLVARDHHTAEFDLKNTLLLLVRVADMACHKLAIGLSSSPSLDIAATTEANLLELSEIDLAELEIMLEDTAGLMS